MANAVFEVKKVQLQPKEGEEEGREITLTPLPIKQLRKFQQEFARLEDADDDEKALDVFFDSAVIAIQARNSGVTAEELEETLDLPTIMEVLRVCGGIEMDPNRLNPATAKE